MYERIKEDYKRGRAGERDVEAGVCGQKGVCDKKVEKGGFAGVEGMMGCRRGNEFENRGGRGDQGVELGSVEEGSLWWWIGGAAGADC